MPADGECIIKGRYNKIAIQNKIIQMASKQGIHCLIKSPTILHPCVTLLRFLSILFLNIFTLLTCTQSVDNLFHSFTVIRVIEYFLISNLHCYFTNTTSCPLVFLS